MPLRWLLKVGGRTMSEFKLPRCPKDVLAAFESLPKEVLDGWALSDVEAWIKDKRASHNLTEQKSRSGET